MVQGLIGQAACYGSSGGQVQNPANVITAAVAPSSNGTSESVGALYVNTATGNMYGLVGKSGSSATWTLLGGASSAVATLTGGSGGAISPSSGNITLAGTANQITTTGAGSTITWSLPSAITAPGSLTTTTTLAANTTVTGGTGVIATTGNITATAGSVNAGTSMTATLGAITATNGNVVMNTAGNGLLIKEGSNARMGQSTLVGGTVTVANTSVTANTRIFISRASVGATGAAATGNLVVGTVTPSTSFDINAVQAADATALQASDVSVVNWLLIEPA